MNRMTSDNTFEMDMRQLALNQVYIGEDGWAWYVKAPDEECRVCDLIRNAAETLGVGLPIPSDKDLPGLLTSFLQYGEEEPEGVLAILYRALWAMTDLRARLSRYEDTGLEPEEIMKLATPPSNTPLTPEQLREMDGDKIYIHYIDGFYTDEDGAYFGKFEQLVRECEGKLTACGLPLEYYGKTWLAYHRKPEVENER